MLYPKNFFVLALFVLVANNAAFAVQTGGHENASEEDLGVISTFLESDFVHTSVWPGLGPFRSTGDDNRMVDPAGNQLTYSVVGKRINSCQLELHGGANEAQCMLNLQMSVDFLLEGLGVKPAQIHIVNSDLTKNNNLLTGNNFNPVQSTIAPFVVSLQNVGVNEGTEASLYRIVVVNRNLDSIKTDATKQEEGSTAKKDNTQDSAVSEEKTTNKGDNNTGVATGSQISKPNAVAMNTAPVNTIPPDEPGNSSMAENAKSDANKNTVAQKTSAISYSEQQKKDFQDVIQNWQRLKQTAVKDRQIAILSQALAGKALIRQSDAIKWLASNHKYYEMTPGGAKIDKVSTLVAGKKYAVYAEVKEKTKYVDDTTGRVIKVNDDTYKVNYTIEKMGSHWLITDSALVKSAAEKAVPQNSTKTATQKPH